MKIIIEDTSPTWQKLYDAWKRWDAKPTADHTTNGLETQVQRMAAQLGITGSQLRDQVNQKRRAGQDLHQALKSIRDEHLTSVDS